MKTKIYIPIILLLAALAAVVNKADAQYPGGTPSPSSSATAATPTPTRTPSPSVSPYPYGGSPTPGGYVAPWETGYPGLTTITPDYCNISPATEEYLFLSIAWLPHMPQDFPKSIEPEILQCGVTNPGSPINASLCTAQAMRNAITALKPGLDPATAATTEAGLNRFAANISIGMAGKDGAAQIVYLADKINLYSKISCPLGNGYVLSILKGAKAALEASMGIVK